MWFVVCGFSESLTATFPESPTKKHKPQTTFPESPQKNHIPGEFQNKPQSTFQESSSKQTQTTNHIAYIHISGELQKKTQTTNHIPYMLLKNRA